MMFRIAQLISNIANPVLLFIPIPYLLVFKTTGDAIAAKNWSAVSALFLFILGLYMLYNVRRGIFSDFDVSHRAERPRLFIFMAILAIVYLGLLHFFQGPWILFYICISLLLGIGLVSIINLRYKASLHVATTTAIISALALIYGGWFILSILLIPVVGWARVKTKRHTIPETCIGAIIGFLLTFLIYGIVEYGIH